MSPSFASGQTPDPDDDGAGQAGPAPRRRRTRTREALLAAGQRLMASGDNASFTIDDLVAAAGVAKGSFYNHYPDRAALVDEIYRQVRDREEAEITEANRDVTDQAARVARAIAVYARLALTVPDEARIILAAGPRNVAPESPVNAGLWQDMQQGLRLARFALPSVEAGALLVFGQAWVLMARLLILPPGASAKALTQQCIALTLLGLGLPHREAHLIAAQAVEDLLGNMTE